MGVQRLERHDERDDAEILSYAEAVLLVQMHSSRRVRTTMRRDRAYTVPHPKKDEPYATVELDYVGNFSMGDDKDPAQYALDMLGYE